MQYHGPDIPFYTIEFIYREHCKSVKMPPNVVILDNQDV